jgi:hypothetical protein
LPVALLAVALVALLAVVRVALLAVVVLAVVLPARSGLPVVLLVVLLAVVLLARALLGRATFVCLLHLLISVKCAGTGRAARSRDAPADTGLGAVGDMDVSEPSESPPAGPPRAEPRRSRDAPDRHRSRRGR